MLTLQHNLDRVRARVARFERGLPRAIREGVSLTDVEAVHQAARQALQAVMEPEEAPHLPAFLATIKLALKGNRASYRMAAPENAAMFLVDAATKLMDALATRVYADGSTGVRRVRQTPTADQATLLQEAREVVRVWVGRHKRKNEQDKGEKPAETYEKVLRVLGIHPDHPSLVQKSQDLKRRNLGGDPHQAAASLAGGIRRSIGEHPEDFEQFRVNTLTPERVRELLMAVLNSWVDLLMYEILPRNMRKMIRLAWKRAGRD